MNAHSPSSSVSSSLGWGQHRRQPAPPPQRQQQPFRTGPNSSNNNNNSNSSSSMGIIRQRPLPSSSSIAAVTPRRSGPLLVSSWSSSSSTVSAASTSRRQALVLDASNSHPNQHHPHHHHHQNGSNSSQKNLHTQTDSRKRHVPSAPTFFSPLATAVNNNHSNHYNNNSHGSRRALESPILVHETTTVTRRTPATTPLPRATPGALVREETAADFSRQSSVTMAGFLSKLGHDVPASLKRRFFVLQPATHLYYFLSPTDTEPRGCLTIDDGDQNGMQCSLTETLPDGRCRFTLTWQDKQQQQDQQQQQPSNHGSLSYRRQVVLEARSEQVAQEWKEAIQTHRYSYVKHERDRLMRRQQTHQDRIRELEKQIANYRFMEKDRDGALEDAARWRQQFESLDEAIRVLTRKISSSTTSTTDAAAADASANDDGPTARITTPTETAKEATSEVVPCEEMTSDEAPRTKTTRKATNVDIDAGTEVDHAKSKEVGNDTNRGINKHHDEDDHDERTGQKAGPGTLQPQKSGQASRETSLLDETLGESTEESHNPAELDVMQVPGLYFNGLHNACQQLQENVRRAGEEAQTAVQDVHEANQKVERLEKRGQEGERHLLQLWEENCTLRKSLKQKKREKRVLIREVRNLQDQVKEAKEKEAQEIAQRPRRPPSLHPPVAAKAGDNGNQTFSDIETSDEEKLMNELEEHVLSSIRIHEQILASQSPTPKSGNMSCDGSRRKLENQLAKAEENHDSSSQARTEVTTNARYSPKRPPLATKRSLFDQDSSDSSDDDDESMNTGDGKSGKATVGQYTNSSTDFGSVSSVLAEASLADDSSSRDGHRRPPTLDAASTVVDHPSIVSVAATSPDTTPGRPNPILQLDAMEEQEKAKEHDDLKHPPYKPTLLSGQATSNLACSLSTTTTEQGAKQRQDGTVSRAADDLRVYHLTFYSRKIGLQFQKVPPPPVKAKGLLTDALRADLECVPDASDRTAAELRTIAALSNRAKLEAPDEKKDDNESLQVATPMDAVLVCGFQGFDDSGANIRPKLGARLVAFDGVSVEVGRWTFDSIRKAIQARSRPLTLSFRNDFLTSEQREILTRAVREANTALVSSVATVEVSSSDMPSSSAPSVHSASSHETGAFVNEDMVVRVNSHHEDRLTFLETDSVSVMTDRSGPEAPLPKMLHNERKRTPYSFRSFSEVGSSTSSVLSAVGPLMAHLLPPPKQPFTPDYLIAKGRSVEETPEHLDFASTLL